MKQVERRVRPDLFAEVTSTLRVSTEEAFYLVQWTRGGRQESARLPAADFVFYHRGDTGSLSGGLHEDLTTPNDAAAKTFVVDVLGPERPERSPHARGRARIGWAWLAWQGAGIALLTATASVAGVVGLILLCAGPLEHARTGRLWVAALWLPFAWVAPGPALVGGLACAALQYLDPDPSYRAARIALCLAAVGLATGQAGMSAVGGSLLLIPGVVAVAAAVLIAGYRSLFFTHRQLLPLAMPFVWAGFALDGRIAAAVVGLGVSAGEALWSGRFSRRARAAARS